MRFELQHADGFSRFTLEEGRLSIGSSPTDDVHVAALPAATLQLSVDPSGACVVAGVAVEVSGVLLHPAVRRRLLPHESVQLAAGVELRPLGAEELPAPVAPASTFSVFRGVLGATDEDGAGLPRLVCLTGLDLDRVFPLGPDVLVIGRAWESDIRLRDRSVSRVHARVTQIEGRHWIRDAGGTNGIAINGRHVETQALLEDGDLIALGLSVLRYLRPPPPGPATGLSASPRQSDPVRASASDPAGADSPEGEPPPTSRAGNRDWPWMAAGATLVALGAVLRVTLA